ncbi:MAG: T9SS type A sorting domain-containing protein [Bacteroidia bacterium]|nr:T9SS type A sorting domain-containing protein [Bacteroidia bacterium]
MMKTKNLTLNQPTNYINTRNFTLLCDPALKLSYPEYDIITLKINQIYVSEIPDTLKALGLATIEGYVADTMGNKLDTYNGILFATIYDKRDSVTTLSNDGLSPFHYTIQNSILYKGKASITNGDFIVRFIVPKDISYRIGKGKLSYYAKISSGSSRYYDANGYYKNVIVGGSADSVMSDNEGPQIEMYMNNSDFVFGGITDENPLFITDLFDLSGINTVGNGIGHDIALVPDGNTSRTINLNDNYEAEIDDYQKGKVEYRFSNLNEGNHTLKLKVWDVYNNSSEAYLEFIVAKSSELILEHVYNYPNPFTTQTAFYFDHNQPNSNLEVLIQIFTITGILVKTINTNVNSAGYRSQPIYWDGLDDYGDRIGRGVYIYKIRVMPENGNIAEKYEKLVILK